MQFVNSKATGTASFGKQETTDSLFSKQAVFFKSRRSQSILSTPLNEPTTTTLMDYSVGSQQQQFNSANQTFSRNSLSSARASVLPRIQEETNHYDELVLDNKQQQSLSFSASEDTARVACTPSSTTMLMTTTSTVSSTFSTGGVSNITCSVMSSSMSRPSSPTPTSPKLASAGGLSQTAAIVTPPLLPQPSTAPAPPPTQSVGPTPSHMAQCLNTALTLAVTHLRAQPGVESCLEHSIFALDCRPSVTLLDYISRLEHHMKCDEHTLVIAAVLISRLEAHLNRPILSPKTVHKVAVTAIVVAKKLHEDKSVKNSLSCQIAGLPVAELNALETQFMKMLGFQLFVNVDQHTKFRAALLTMMPSPQISPPTTPSTRN
eukprot:c2960_g1_i1.p1 GENE.c2960_g1_i1~~c2960_g1_i1.p1  ORF type:complete len:376 (-),score=81.90 c2960_g1_i1:258-1385(-)